MSRRANELLAVHSDPKPSRLKVPCSGPGEIELISAGQLRGELAERWSNLRSQNDRFASPYFDIEFTKAVARIRPDVEIAVLSDRAGQVNAFLPFQRVGTRGEPIGGLLNDVHGVIGSVSDQADFAKRVMATADLSSFSFHASNMNDPGINQCVFRHLSSHYIDLRSGWDVYEKWSRFHSTTIRRHRQKTRAMSRHFGPLRFEFDCRDPDLLERLIELKRTKYQRTKTFDILSVQWAADLLREISQIQTRNFKGLLSVLYAGDELVAAHFGMVTDQILHYWFPTFDSRYAKFSPGTELLLRVARQAAEQGVTKVDLGYGDDSYKFKFCNGHESVSFGRVTSSRLAFELARRQYEIRQGLKQMPMKPLAKTVLRRFFPRFGEWNFK
jgi:CelD/BcsL family acetyltransferase involved in cellulose biosynthesis